MRQKLMKTVCYSLILSLMILNISVPMAKAEMISTETTIESSQNVENRLMVTAFLEREDMRQALISNGIDVTEAAARIHALSDQEVAQLAQQIEDMPAGAGAVGAILGVALLVFIILLVTDLAGATDVFPFVKN